MTVENSSGNAADLFAAAPYDAATLASMFEAYAAAWHELQMMNVVDRRGTATKFGRSLWRAY